MELKEALENIKIVADDIAENEIEIIRSNREEAIESLKSNVDHIFTISSDLETIASYKGHIYSMYLLAEFKEKSAFDSLIKILELDKKLTDELLMDIITEDFASILASVSTLDNVDKIMSIIENDKLDNFHRMAAVVTLITLYSEGVIEQKYLYDYLLKLITNENDDHVFLSQLSYECAALNVEESFDTINKYYERNIIDLEVLSKKEFLETKKDNSIEIALKNLQHDHHTKYIEDTCDAVSWFGVFAPPVQAVSEKVGRNEPCPCGSGKKYKKCCA